MTSEEIQNKRLERLLRHITNVREATNILGHNLIERGEDQIGRELIANGLIHDHSKFSGIEWLYLHDDVKIKEPEKFQCAALQHVHTNEHHPEYWGSIHEMPRLYVAEMVCDWKARSSEFGNDLMEWIEGKATEKFDMSIHSPVYQQIVEFKELLLDPMFV
jgi:hypothetical protein